MTEYEYEEGEGEGGCRVRGALKDAEEDVDDDDDKAVKGWGSSPGREMRQLAFGARMGCFLGGAGGCWRCCCCCCCCCASACFGGLGLAGVLGLLLGTWDQSKASGSSHSCSPERIRSSSASSAAFGMRAFRAPFRRAVPTAAAVTRRPTKAAPRGSASASSATTHT